MMQVWTIKGRLIWSLITLLAGFWILGVVVAGLIVHHEIEEVFDSALRETAAQVIPIALHEYELKNANKLNVTAEISAASLSISRGHMHFRLRNPQGDVLVASRRAPTEVLPLPNRSRFYEHAGFRYYLRKIDGKPLWIEVAQEAHERSETATGIWISLVSPLLALLPVAAFAVWRTVGRATEPISRLSKELETRGGHHLDPIDNANLPAELLPMVWSVNTLIQRLEAALTTERGFAANAAHELRNPIASARAQLQVFASKLQNTADSSRAENIASQLAQLGRQVEKLLQWSRAEAGIGHMRERTDLGSIVSLVVDEYSSRPDLEERLVVEIPEEPVWVFIDPDALAIVLRNALENAIVHGRAEAPVVIALRGPHALSISNSCDVLPREALKDLTGRFKRTIAARWIPGTGLGLAIVDTLMRQAGGSVKLASPIPEKPDGFEIVLNFSNAL